MRREREALSQSSLISLGWKGRNANHEANSGPLTTNNGNIPSHGLQQGFNPCQSESQSRNASMSFLLQPNETIKDGVLLFHGDPHSVILKGDAKVNVTTNTNFHATPAIFHCIAEEVSQDLL